jgi:hypothetical protein
MAFFFRRAVTKAIAHGAVSRLDLCLERLSDPEFAEHVWTDHITVPEVAERIAESSGLSLTPTRTPTCGGVSAGCG